MEPVPRSAADFYRVIVVDDSAVVRGLMTRTLENVPGFRIVATAANGKLAIDALTREPADVVVLDIEMPVMDGLTAIPHLKAIDPGVQIMMSSTLTQKNAEVSVKAMELGATDYITKPTAAHQIISTGANNYAEELIEKVKVLAALARRKNVRPLSAAQQAQASAATPSAPVAAIPKPAAAPAADKKKLALRPMPAFRPAVLAIGSSTGGPQALFEVIKSIGNVPQPVMITQHMPPSFTTILAEHITKQCGVTCAEGKDDEPLVPGRYYVAPGDFHMTLAPKGADIVIKLTKGQPENYCRPSVDPMLRSLVEIYRGKVLTTILTGMGQDGLKGGQVVVDAGGAVIAQDEATSVVWGMPGAVAMAGICSAVLPLNEIGAMVRQIATRIGA